MNEESSLNLLPGVSEKYVRERLGKAPGKELETGKFSSPESSSALAVNCFAWFVDRPRLFPPLHDSLRVAGTPDRVDIEFSARFPWNGGRHPWLDAAVETGSHLIGIESKRFEPFRGRKAISFSDAYDRPVWGDDMVAFEKLRDDLRAGRHDFQHLDVVQLMKHAFGLVTEGRRLGKAPVLVYIYAEPAVLSGRPIPSTAHARHRDEIERLRSLVEGAAVPFYSTSYASWLASWSGSSELIEHANALRERFAV